MAHHLAQINLARLAFPLDDPRMEEFVRALEPINQIAELTPGFVWRLKSDDGRSATYAAHAFDPDIIVNYTVWASRESLRHFTYQSGHSAYFRRRLEWFVPLGRPTLAMWWVPAGTVPSLEEAKGRYDYLVEHGPSERAFTLKEDFPPPA
ncbi:MAG: DUF3291 domain-containing protein [Meiothermus sp.]|nr:DUF3291 domain-containing protein [Meiothermus sp.]